MDDVTTVPPMSILTCAVVAPLITSTILPLRTLRALILMPLLPFCHWRRCQQCVELRLAQVDVVEQFVEIACDDAKVFRKLRRIENGCEPAHADQAIDARRVVKPAKRQAGRKVDALL